jgi:hypothetical protein
MDRAMIEEHLRQAEEHIALGEQHIARQREILAELQRDGHDTAQAEELLATFEETQRMHIADRDRIQDELQSLR